MMCVFVKLFFIELYQSRNDFIFLGILNVLAKEAKRSRIVDKDGVPHILGEIGEKREKFFKACC